MARIFKSTEGEQEFADKFGRYVSAIFVALLAVAFAYGYLRPFIFG